MKIAIKFEMFHLSKNVKSPALDSYFLNEALVHSDESNTLAVWPSMKAMPPSSSVSFLATPPQHPPPSGSKSLSTKASPPDDVSELSTRAPLAQRAAALKRQQQQQQPIKKHGKSAIQNSPSASEQQTWSSSEHTVTPPRASKSIPSPAEASAYPRKSHHPTTGSPKSKGTNITNTAPPASEQQPSTKDINSSLTPNNYGVGAILSRAEDLLNAVKSVTSASTKSPRSVSGISPIKNSTELKAPTVPVEGGVPLATSKDDTLTNGPIIHNHSNQFHLSFPKFTGPHNENQPLLLGGGIDGKDQLSQIDWLLRGVTEVYDDFETNVDDETIKKLLQEGGQPPSQLTFPSLYAASQRAMEKLKAVKYLNIHVSHLVIFSSRFGVRRECSQILIRGPSGSVIPAYQPTAKMIHLKELRYTEQEELQNFISRKHSATEMSKKGASNSGLRDFFVGNVDLNIFHSFQLELNDDVVREWLQGTRNGCIKLELHSSVLPSAANHTHKNKSVSLRNEDTLQCFGFVYIPLNGLLNSEFLDAIFNCDLEVDASTHSSVASRMNALPFSRQLHGKPLSNKLGLVTARIYLSSTNLEQENANNNCSDKDSKRESDAIKIGATMPPSSSPNLPNTSHVGKDMEKNTHGETSEAVDPLNEPLNFIPTEAARSTISPPEKLHVGIVLYGIDNLSLTEKMTPSPQHNFKFTVKYKLSRDHVEVTDSNIFTPRDKYHHHLKSAALSSVRVYDVQSESGGGTAWQPPIFEVWMETAYDENEAIHISRFSPVQKSLCGLATCPIGWQSGCIHELPILCIKSLRQVGTLVVLFHVHNDKHRAEVTSLLTAQHSSYRRDDYYQDKSDINTFDRNNDHHNDSHQLHEKQSKPIRVEIGTTKASSIIDIKDVSPSEALQPPTPLPPSNEALQLSSIDSLTGVQTLPPNHLRESIDSRLSVDSLSFGEDLPQDDKDRIERSEVGEEEEGSDAATFDVPSEIKSVNPMIPTETETKELVTAPSTYSRSVRVLDLKVEGCSHIMNVNDREDTVLQSSLGCIISYSFPALLPEVSKISTESTMPHDPVQSCSSIEDHSIWWDRGCAVINSSNRHKFELNATISPLKFAEMIAGNGVNFSIRIGDSEGCISASTPIAATCFLDATTFRDILGHAGCSRTLSLPLLLADGVKSTSNGVLLLQISHRLQPIENESPEPATYIAPMQEYELDQQQEEQQHNAEDIQDNNVPVISKLSHPIHEIIADAEDSEAESLSESIDEVQQNIPIPYPPVASHLLHQASVSTSLSLSISSSGIDEKNFAEKDIRLSQSLDSIFLPSQDDRPDTTLPPSPPRPHSPTLAEHETGDGSLCELQCVLCGRVVIPPSAVDPTTLPSPWYCSLSDWENNEHSSCFDTAANHTSNDFTTKPRCMESDEEEILDETGTDMGASITGSDESFRGKATTYHNIDEFSSTGAIEDPIFTSSVVEPEWVVVDKVIVSDEQSRTSDFIISHSVESKNDEISNDETRTSTVEDPCLHHETEPLESSSDSGDNIASLDNDYDIYDIDMDIVEEKVDRSEFDDSTSSGDTSPTTFSSPQATIENSEMTSPHYSEVDIAETDTLGNCVANALEEGTSDTSIALSFVSTPTREMFFRRTKTADVFATNKVVRDDDEECDDELYLQRDMRMYSDDFEVLSEHSSASHQKSDSDNASSSEYIFEYNSRTGLSDDESSGEVDQVALELITVTDEEEKGKDSNNKIETSTSGDADNYTDDKEAYDAYSDFEDNESKESDKLNYSSGVDVELPPLSETILHDMPATSLSYNDDKESSNSNSQDSPVTAKIRRIISEEVSKVMQSEPSRNLEIMKQPINSVETNPLIDGKSCNQLNTDANVAAITINTLNDLANVASLPVVNDEKPVSAITENIPQFQPKIDLKSKSIARLVEQIAAAKSSANRSSSSTKILPGKQRQFIDSETDRISRIMMGLGSSKL